MKSSPVISAAAIILLVLNLAIVKRSPAQETAGTDSSIPETGLSAEQQLFSSIDSGDLDSFQKSIEAGADINTPDPLYKNQTPLILAAWWGRMEIVNELINLGADTGAVDDDGNNALLGACFRADINLVQSLVSAGADINHRNNNGESALHIAATRNRPDLVSYLLQLGAAKDAVDKYGNSPMKLAIEFEAPECVQVLLESGANPDLTDKDGITPRMIGEKSPVESINQIFADLRARELLRQQQIDQFVEAAGRGDLDTLNELYKLGVAVNARDSSGKLALFSGILKGQSEVVQWLLQVEASLDVLSTEGLTPLQAATTLNERSMIEYLLSEGRNIDETGSGGETALIYSCRNDFVESIRILLENGASMEVLSREGLGPLDLVLSLGHDKSVRLLALFENGGLAYQLFQAVKAADAARTRELLESGAPADLWDENDMTVMGWATEFNALAILEILFEFGADAKSGHGDKTPLMMAAINGRLDTLQTILDGAGLDSLDMTDRNGKTALYLALEHDHLEIVEFLMQWPRSAFCYPYHLYSPVMLAMQRQHLDLARKLLKLPDSEWLLVNRDSNGRRHLFTAARYGDADLVKSIIIITANPNPRNCDLKTPLFIAVEQGDVERTRALLDFGANIHARDRFGRTAYEYAIAKGHRELIPLLKSVATSLEYELHQAVLAHDLESLRNMIDEDVDVNFPDRMGVTPLLKAISRYDLDAAHILLGAGADANARDRNGANAWVYAYRLGNNRDQLDERGTPSDYGMRHRTVNRNDNINTSSNVSGNEFREQLLALFEGPYSTVEYRLVMARGMSLLMSAAYSGDRELVRSCVAGGASIYDRDNQGRNALDWALIGRQDEKFREYMTLIADNPLRMDVE